MRKALATTRAALSWVALTAVSLGAGLVAATPANAATTTYTANTSVNVRTGPSTTKTILAQLKAGQVVRSAGKVSGDWLPISYDNTTAYVWADYLDANRSSTGTILAGPSGRRTATVNVNVRASASLSAAITTILTKGTLVKVTGYASSDFVQAVVDGKTSWVHSRFLSSKTDTTPVPVASFTTTAKLALRTSASVAATNQGTMAVGKTVGATGVHSGSYSQVVYAGKVGWVITGYLKATTGTPKNLVLPMTKGARWAVTKTPVLATASANATVLSDLPAAAAVRITGTTSGSFTQVIWNGATAWVTTKKLTANESVVDLGSDSLNKLEPNGKAAVREIRATFPKITTIYGWRSASAYSSDHPNGRAADFMIPNYKSNKALGDSVAKYFIDNGKRLNVTYIIWRQRSYTISRGSWKAMADRGSDNQNHMNHVHVSFEPS